MTNLDRLETRAAVSDGEDARRGSKRVVITGMGAITPIGNTLADYWDGLMAGRSGIGPIPI